MNKKKKIILWVIDIFLFFGVVGSFGSSNSNVQSVATSQSGQTTISPIRAATIAISKITVIPTATPKPTIKPVPTTYIAPTTRYVAPTTYIQQTTPPAPATNQSNGLSNDNYYQNVDGNQVHSPAYSTNNSVPTGATTKCNNGTYSFSQHHSGTCSGHNGVAQ